MFDSPKTMNEGNSDSKSLPPKSSSTPNRDSFFYTKRSIHSSSIPLLSDVLNLAIRIGGAALGLVSGYFVFNNHMHQLFGVHSVVEDSTPKSPQKAWISKFIRNNYKRKLLAKTSVGLISIATSGVFVVCSVPFVHFIARVYYTCKITSFGLMKDLFDNSDRSTNGQNKENET
nr:unnamed protein product [Naegleria fowleri]